VHVRGGDPLGRRHVAADDRLEELQLVVDHVVQTRRQRRVACHRHVEDPQRQVVVPIDRLRQERVLPASVDEAVNATVEGEQRREPVALGQRVQLVHELGVTSALDPQSTAEVLAIMRELSATPEYGVFLPFMDSW